MNSFPTSTQYRNWIKTKEELQAITKNKIVKINKRINEVNNIIRKENEAKALKNKAMNKENSNDNFQKYISTKNFFLKIDEERLLIINYSNKLIKILNSQQDLSTSLKSSALSYFRRFFLKKSILDYNANFLMASAFRLGAKISSMNYTLNDYKKVFPFIENSLNNLNEY